MKKSCLVKMRTYFSFSKEIVFLLFIPQQGVFGSQDFCMENFILVFGCPANFDMISRDNSNKNGDFTFR